MRVRSALALLSLTVCTTACPDVYVPSDSDGGTGESTGTSAATMSTTGEPTGGTTGSTTGTSDEPTTTAGSATVTTTGNGNCGDGVVGPGETCDGADLDGKTCEDINPNFIGGTLACSEDCLLFETTDCELDPSAALVALNELTSKGLTDAPDAGDAVELTNAGAVAADISGWKLSDDPAFPADKTYVFPPGSMLQPGQFLVLVELDEQMMIQLPFGISSSEMETIALADARGVTIDQVTVNGADAEVSWCRLPDGTGQWQPCAQTFGAPNASPTDNCGDNLVQAPEECDGVELGGQTCVDLGFDGGVLACSATCTFDQAGCTMGQEELVAINELESTNDAIELHNAGAQPLDISGWILTDDVVGPNYDPALDTEKLVFAADTSLAAEQFLVVAKGVGPGQHPFGLSSGGDTVTLLRADLTVADQVTYGADQAVVSYCRLPDGPGGTWTAGCMATFGMANKGP